MDVERVYSKSFLLMKEEEKQELIRKFKDVVKSVEKMMEVDTRGVDFYEITSEVVSPLREDLVEKSLDRDLVFSNTKHKEYGYFKLDRILED